MLTALSLARSRVIHARAFDLNIPDDTPRYWMNGDPYHTHLMNALSFMFPGGERFFIESVLEFRRSVKDPVLSEQMRGFAHQEGRHTREHAALNRWHARYGLDGEAIERQCSAFTDAKRKRLAPLKRLAMTCALEHLTAILAAGWLEQEELWRSPVEPMRSLWVWHALEELDHKSVAFDVYQEVSGRDYWTRALSMAMTSLEFVVGAAFMHLRFLVADGQIRRPRYLLKSWWAFWGPRGHFARLIPDYLAYYKRDFHPWQDDHRELIARFHKLLYEAEPRGQDNEAPGITTSIGRPRDSCQTSA